VKCGNINIAQSVFDRATKKDLAIYGSMMKGNNSSSLVFK
jgi:hypothetical protein